VGWRLSSCLLYLILVICDGQLPYIPLAYFNILISIGRYCI
jgi:hypothetical protein